MNRFDPVLRRVERELDLPEPTRSRVLGEMAADLEDLYRVYRERGLAEEEAERRALSLLGASPAAVGELRAVHESVALRLLRRFSRPGEGRLGPGLVTILTLAVVVTGGATLVGAGLLRSMSPAVGVVAAVGALGAATAVWKAVGLHLHPEALGRPVEREAGPVFFLAGASVVAGLGAGLLVLQGAAPPEGGAGADLAWTAFWATVRDAAVTSTLGLVLGLGLGLAGAHLHRRARVVRRAMEGTPELAGPAAEVDPVRPSGDPLGEERVS